MAALSAGGKLTIALLEGRQNIHTCVHLLKSHLLNQGEKSAGLSCIFQQNNSYFHSAYDTKMWFEDNKINTLDQPVNIAT